MESGNEIEILLVEDNPYDAELALISLNKHHLANKIVHVRDGAQALEFLFCTGPYAGGDHNSHPKVILLDLKLLRVDGLEVLRAMKSNPKTRHIPVVVMTSSREHRDIVDSYHLGVNSYIVENFSAAVGRLSFYWLLLNKIPPAADVLFNAPSN